MITASREACDCPTWLVIAYHHFCGYMSGSTHLWVDPTRLRDQLQGLVDLGFRPGTIGDVVSRHRAPAERNLVVTVDDGAADFMAAAEVFVELGIRPTLFIVPEWAQSGRAEWLSFQMLRSIVSCVDVGCHSARHLVLPEMDESSLYADLSQSKGDIEDALGVGCDHFAYPYGRFDDRVVSLLDGLGYTSSCTTIDGLNHTIGPNMTIKRIAPRGTDSQGQLTRDVLRYLDGKSHCSQVR